LVVKTQEVNYSARLLLWCWVVWGSMKGVKVREVENQVGRWVQGYMTEVERNN
jgi:hypothetical protein